MARRVMIAGNWKLNKTVAEALDLVRELRRLLSQVRDCDLVVAPPYTAIHPVAKALEEANISVAAQDLYYEDAGAFTGTVSAPMLKEAGCSYVLVGHSERRQFFGETEESSGLRVRAALRGGLSPILCIGETLDERKADRTMAVVASQLDAGIAGLTVEELGRMVIAYEPVWAIGTGEVASPAQAQQVHAMIRERLRAVDAGLADRMQILYGGSMKPGNAGELLQQEDIDGGLIGGASLEAEAFVGIVKARPAV